MTQPTASPPSNSTPSRWFYSLLLGLVMMAAAYFRFSGLDWGEYQYLHPDERFLIWVGSDISPVKSLEDYFNTPVSSLNPNNRGHGFYVYGTLPMFLTRYIVEAVYGHSGFREMTDVGRILSALMDLGTVFLVYLTARRLYDQRAGLLAAALSAGVALQIQQSHFFTMETFLTLFSFLAFYIAVILIKSETRADKSAFVSGTDENQISKKKSGQWLSRFISHPLFWPSLGFGVALGMAVASKLNTVAVAVVLPAAMGLYLLRFPPDRRMEQLTHVFTYLVMAACVSLIIFRIFQPYAFSGPGFFGVKPNPIWVDNILEQRAQSTGDVDFPPAMQWARRPIWFSLQNMVLWGLGLPLGLLAWIGFCWAGWRLCRGWRRPSPEWISHALIWGWTAVYFIWQSLQFNPTMRYQLPIYPTLTILAAWAAIAFYDRAKNEGKYSEIKRRWIKTGAVLVGGAVLISTTAYAYAFTQIYTRPITRVEASRWIYQNIPGPITLPIQTETGIQNQILPFPYDYSILPELPYSVGFKPKTAGRLSEIKLPHIVDKSHLLEPRTLSATIKINPADDQALASGSATFDKPAEGNPADSASSLIIHLTIPLDLDPDLNYYLTLSLPHEKQLTAFDTDAALTIEPYSGSMQPFVQNIRLTNHSIQSDAPLTIHFRSEADGVLTQVKLNRLPSDVNVAAPQPLRVSLLPSASKEEPIFTSVALRDNLSGLTYALDLIEPLPVMAGASYRLSISMEPRGGRLVLSGIGLANEGDWDDGLPLRIDGYDGFAGIYPRDLNFNMYWDDNVEKVERFIRILDEAEYLVISSNRQWGTLPRIPERFPMTTAYYRELLGCPTAQNLVDCYRVAEPGMFSGSLGFELVKVFTSDPRLGSIRLNDQFAEEAFTVYDHPKVMIFRKTAKYDPQETRRILNKVDLTKIIRKPPLKYGSNPADLMLPADRWQAQQKGGTWSELFNPESPINQSQMLAVIVWYLTVTLLGWFFFPILRLALPGLEDRGYPLARTAGMLALSYLVWLAGSFEIPFTRVTISVTLGLLATVGATLAYKGRRDLISEWRQRKRYFLIVEAVYLLFFITFLLVRFGNPDLWHPWKGGEKPMDFSYFNAVLKSSSFPPYDPWYAGGYLNYYYFGFVFVGTLVKWLGITPSVAYNLIIPTLFGMVGLGAFSIAWNISQQAQACRANNSPGEHRHTFSPYIPAAGAALGCAVFGNLGMIKMILQGFQKIAAPGGMIEGAHFIRRLGWTIAGFIESIQGTKLPYGIGDWYWNPSRIIPAPGDIEPITEFPYFTILYADLHAHLIALPITLLALALIIAIVLGKAGWHSRSGGALWFALTALSIGALRPTNTWDFPVFLTLGVFAVIYAFLRKPFEKIGFSKTATDTSLISDNSVGAWIPKLPPAIKRLMKALGGAGVLVFLSLLFFLPYGRWYALGYTRVNLWEGTHTPLSAYFYHWGLFLIVILPWMIWETRDWMAKTPLSALNKLKPHLPLIQFLLGALLLTVGLLVFWRGVSIAWLVLPMAVWTAMLIARPGQPDAKRAILFLIGSGLTLTLMVEVLVLRGDIGRMNTVFKFYLQVWTMFSISAGAALGWLLPALADWKPSWRWTCQAAFSLLIAGAAFYPLMATTAKIKDRMAENAPHSLDGMAYMRYATFRDEWGEMDLAQDYEAIRWLQENVEGSPVILEANLRNLYRWGSRMTIYTGLPGVVGWEWHQQQQRAVTPGTWVTERILEVDSFYLSPDLEQAAAFLQKYGVQYIIVGQQERGHYPGPGLDKFVLADGILWREVFRSGDTVIYQVIEANL